MMNSFVIVGRLVKFIKEDENSVVAVIKTKKANMIDEEKYEVEEYEIEVIMNGSIKDNSMKYCSIGNILGVKGYISENNKLITDKVTFLSSKKGEE